MISKNGEGQKVDLDNQVRTTGTQQTWVMKETMIWVKIIKEHNKTSGIKQHLKGRKHVENVNTMKRQRRNINSRSLRSLMTFSISAMAYM